MATKWTVAEGPRVYEVARFLDVPSKGVLSRLQRFWGFKGMSASSKVPMHLALGFCSWYGDIDWPAPKTHWAECGCLLITPYGGGQFDHDCGEQGLGWSLS